MPKYRITVVQRAEPITVDLDGSIPAANTTSSETQLDIVAADIRAALDLALTNRAFNPALGRVKSLHAFELLSS